MQVHMQLSKEVESQTGVTISREYTAYTAEEWHAWVPSTKEASPKAQAQKSPPRVCQGPCWQRWRLLGLYTLEWWDQDKCFCNWWLQNCMASQRWGIQRKMHGAYSETMWGCMSAAGVGELHFIDDIMNSQMYCSILKEKMLYIYIVGQKSI